MTDFRALCAELLEIFDRYDEESNLGGIIWDMKSDGNDLLDRARAALAQPEPQGPTDEELPPKIGHILKLAEIIREVDGNHDKGAAALAEEILSHPSSEWSPEIEPVPVSERLPAEADCDAKGNCWFWHPYHIEDAFTEGWMLLSLRWADGLHDSDDSPVYTHWLPHHALPVPTTTKAANDTI